MLTPIVTTVLSAVLKKAASLAGLKMIAHGFTVYSAFDTACSIHQCTEIPRCLVKLGYDSLIGAAVEQLVDRVIDNRFDVSCTASGLYLASRKPILQPDAVYPSLDVWQNAEFSVTFAERWRTASDRFMRDLREQRDAFEAEIKRCQMR